MSKHKFTGNSIANIVSPLILGVKNEESFTNIILSILWGISITLLFKIILGNNENNCIVISK